MPQRAPNIDVLSAFWIELLGTFALALVVLTVGAARKLQGNYIYGLAIGFTLAAMIFVGGKISGGVFNPAAAIGLITIDTIRNGTSLQCLALYTAGPLLGGILAGYVFGYLNQE